MEKCRTLYREKRYICGMYLDAFIYPVYKQPGNRQKKAKPSTETQTKLNERHSTEKLTRMLHANFTPEDVSVGLDYAINPEGEDRAKKDIRNFLSRAKRMYKKLGLPFKYITVTERSSRGRYHHHVTMSGGVDRDTLEKLWGLGRANSKRLQYGEGGLAGLAKYVSKAPIFYRRWNASRNVIDPDNEKPRDHLIRSRRKATELGSDPEDSKPWEKLYPGHRLSEMKPFHNEENGGVYLFARLYRLDGEFIPPRKKSPRNRKTKTGRKLE
jgi:hypothetical protein